MKRSTPDGKKPASEKAPVRELVPQYHPPAERAAHKIIMNVGGKRFELTRHLEVREIRKGPAIVIEMPKRPSTKL
jgi:hypothetical protein